jgi:hypothetical protein
MRFDASCARSALFLSTAIVLGCSGGQRGASRSHVMDQPDSGTGASTAPDNGSGGRGGSGGSEAGSSNGDGKTGVPDSGASSTGDSGVAADAPNAGPVVNETPVVNKTPLVDEKGDRSWQCSVARKPSVLGISPWGYGEVVTTSHQPRNTSHLTRFDIVRPAEPDTSRFLSYRLAPKGVTRRRSELHPLASQRLGRRGSRRRLTHAQQRRERRPGASTDQAGFRSLSNRPQRTPIRPIERANA